MGCWSDSGGEVCWDVLWKLAGVSVRVLVTCGRGGVILRECMEGENVSGRVLGSDGWIV